MLNSDCGGIYAIKEGQELELSSPNYPEDYPSQMECFYLVEVIIFMFNIHHGYKNILSYRVQRTP